MIAKTLTRPQSKERTAPLMEIFSSIQGEGAYLGEPQIFVRFARCPLRCLYCDTPESWAVKDQYQLFEGKKSSLHSNPATVEQILSHCRRLDKKSGRTLTVSLTGGEPLLYPDFIAALAPKLRAKGRRVHLETAGVHPRGLEKVLSVIDHISMDWKLPSTLEEGQFHEVQKNFLRKALEVRDGDLVIKIVITPEASEKEFRQSVDAIANIDSRVSVILQPATPARKIRSRVSGEKINRFLSLALQKLQNVRVLPQLHPLLGLK